MTVVFQPKETPIKILFDKARDPKCELALPLNEDDTEMSYETFKNGLTDPESEFYMDMERLMIQVYPRDAGWRPLC